MAVNSGKTLTFEVSGTEPATFTVKITNVNDTSLSGVLAEISVDFKNEDTEPEIVSYDEGLFKKLKYVATEVSGSVTVTLPTNAAQSGTFNFTYMDSDGNVIKTETKDMSLAAGKPVSFDVSGKDKRTYLIKITNVKDEALTGTLAEIEIDFSTGTVKQNVISYDQNLFNNLKFISTEASGEHSEETDE